MKKLVQNYKTGKVSLLDVVSPVCSTNEVLIRTSFSLVSVGTERSILSLGKKSLLGKAMARPDLVKRVIEKVKTEGLLKTYRDVKGRLEDFISLGYSACGFVEAVGSEIKNLKKGDFVSVVGANVASHTELIRAPEMQCLRVSEDVGKSAAFGMLGIIALHGVRTIKKEPGSVVGVLGLGLLGLLTIQILEAYGYEVFAFEPDQEKCDLAGTISNAKSTSNFEELEKWCLNVSDGAGCDAVIITAATQSSQPVNQALKISRSGGRIVITGVCDIHPDRNELWEKEVDLIVSKAGGAGSLDPVYENQGIDLPIQNARWTQKRNLKAFFSLVEKNKIKISPLITHEVNIEDSLDIYSTIEAGKDSVIGAIINYPSANKVITNFDMTVEKNNVETAKSSTLKKVSINIGLIGAGQFARSSLIPPLSKISGVNMRVICSRSPETGADIQNRFGFENVTSSASDVFKDKKCNGVIISTRHSSHSKLILDSLSAKKQNIFVEKPLCTNLKELREIESKLPSSGINLMVGYNRRYSMHAQKVKKFFINSEIKCINYHINAGNISPDHWVHSAEEGRSRIVGEICHFLDLAQYFCDSLIETVHARSIKASDHNEIHKDNLVITLGMKAGQIVSLTYCSLGNRNLSREIIYIHGNQKSAVIDNFRVTKFYCDKKIRKFRTMSQDLGYKKELEEFCSRFNSTGKPNNNIQEILNSTRASFSIEDSLNKHLEISV